jgi:hypothetical protein
LCCAVLWHAGLPDAEASMMRHLHVLQIVMVSKLGVACLAMSCGPCMRGPASISTCSSGKWTFV